MIMDYRLDVYQMCKATRISVYDYWVTDKQFPYIVTYSTDETSLQLKDTEQTDYIFEIHIFDKGKGKKSVIDIINLLKDEYKNIDGIGKTFNYRVIEDVQPSVVHGIVTLRFKNYK